MAGSTSGGAQGAVFKILLRDDRFDQYFTASDYLRRRMAAIRLRREDDGLEVTQPTFADITRTHVLFTRTIYRPFVNLACEYLKVQPSGGVASLVPDGGGALTFDLPTYGHFTSDMVFHLRFDDVGTQAPVYPLPPPAPPPPAGTLSPLYRFCAYPGIRVFRRVEFRSDETLVDDYTADEVSFVNKFEIPSDRRPGWDRGMGQQELREANVSNSNDYTSVHFYKDGLQTLKFFHGGVDLWIPIQFDFCRDVSRALLNDLIPNSQRRVVVTLESLANIVRQFNQASGDLENLAFTGLGFNVSLYVNNIFVDPEIHEVFASRIGFSLIRVHRRQQKTLTMSNASILMDQLKYPAEFLYMGIRDRDNANNFDQWHLFGHPRTRDVRTTLRMPVAFWNTALGTCQFACRVATEVSTLDSSVDNLRVTAHGVDLYPQLPGTFFSTYLPQRNFGSTALVTPIDVGAMLIGFCVLPGQHNPSGYYNLSAGRELYLEYTSSVITPTNQAELVVTMSALNFLIRRGDKMSLRYAL